MLKYNCIFLDRDGTLNPDSGYISSITNFKLFDFTISSLKQIAEIGNRFCIVTNQSGVSRGLIKEEALREIHDFITIKFQKFPKFPTVKTTTVGSTPFLLLSIHQYYLNIP